MSEQKLLYLLSEADGLYVNLVKGLWKAGERLPREVYPQRLDLLAIGRDDDLEDIDRCLLPSLKMAQAYRSERIRLQRADGFTLLKRLLKTGRVYYVKQGNKPLTLSAETERVIPVWNEFEHGCMKTGFEGVNGTIFTVVPPCLLDGQHGAVIPLEAECSAAALCAWIKEPPLPLVDVPHFVARMRKQYDTLNWPMPAVVEAQQQAAKSCIPHLQLEFAGMDTLFMMGSATEAGELVNGYLRGRLTFRYTDCEVSWNAADDVLVVQNTFMTRDAEVETAAMVLLEKLGGAAPAKDRGQFWSITGSWEQFVQDAVPQLKQAGWQVETPSDMSFVTPKEEDWYAELKKKKGGWFDLELGVDLHGKRINLLPIILSIIRSMPEMSREALDEFTGAVYPVLLGAGAVVEVPGERVRKIIEGLIELQGGDPLDKKGRLKLTAWRAAELGDIEEWSDRVWAIGDAARHVAEALQKYPTIRRRNPAAGFATKLRAYQRQGLGWLLFLMRYELGGILADDMGLGKTVQTLAALHIRKKEALKTGRPTLIVAPRSVLFNWLDEGARFVPELSMKVYYGTERTEVLAAAEPGDILLTTYAIMRNDTEVLQKVFFDGIILDEAHVMKNDQSLTARRVTQLHSSYRFCLTGTPIQNHMGELWSLFNFLLPGYMGTRDGFNEQFRFPIENQGCVLTADCLRKRMALFLLRRKKEDVLNDLPPKTESVQRIRLSREQREVYNVVRTAAEKSVREAINEKGMERSQIDVLTALLRLRQTCCDPRLVPGFLQCRAEHSAKLQWLRDMLPEMIEDGRRILIFSQFVTVLNYVSELLQELTIRYEMLTGSTRNREQVVAAFQQGEAPVFLISMKAGGVGLNLTAADTVILFDPWWNPAIEQQATDRAHRIGQQKPVFVYKLIAAGSIEERILQLQKEKVALVQDLLTEQTHETLRIDSETIEYLLAPMQ